MSMPIIINLKSRTVKDILEIDAFIYYKNKQRSDIYYWCCCAKYIRTTSKEAKHELLNKYIDQNTHEHDPDQKEELILKTAFKRKASESMDSLGPFIQNGTIRTPIGTKDRLEFCLDFFATRRASFLAFGIIADPEDPYEKAKFYYIAAGMLISSFFMILVLFVYAVLPSLQNIVGMVLIAYLISLTMAYILRASQLIAAYEISMESCQTLTPATYFFYLASFFWLNIMTFDLWWTLRGSRKRRDIHRRGERVKFLTYCVYAWGIPALMTSTLVILDRRNAIVDPRFKPPFESNLRDSISTRLYFYLPIGIMTVVNCILFALTVYNIWLIRKSIVNSKDSRNTKNSENRSKIYGKLFVLMGVTWIFEQIPSVSLPWHIVLNSMNLFVGVIIFYIFVCKKSTIVMLCNRFNIRNSYVDKLQSSNYSKTENTCVRFKSSSSGKFREGTELSTCSTRL